MTIFFLSFLCAFFVALFTIHFNSLHSTYSADLDLIGIQKFHTHATPRIGGFAIIFGAIVAELYVYFQNAGSDSFGLLLIACAFPAFIAGFIEDLTKKIGIKVRLIATIFSAILAGYFLESWLSSIQVIGVDNLMIIYPSIAIGITCFAVAGVSNAFNIIDGFNGLSSVVAILILSGIGCVAYEVGDQAIMTAAIVMIGSIFGFLVWNYPRGLIFLGDGGAYLIGFWIAELSVLLTARHENVAKWFPLLLCIYPIFETVFSIYRRVVIKRVNPGLPDASHLHQLIYRRVVRLSGLGNYGGVRLWRNSLTSLYLWALSLLGVIPAVLFWRNHWVLKVFVLIFCISYILIYWAIVNFKFPKYLVISGQR